MSSCVPEGSRLVGGEAHPDDSDQLEELFGPPLQRVRDKMASSLGAWHSDFIRLSPFAVLATSDSAGRHDASPRGGPPGFVRILDANTLFLPEEQGNRLFQSLRNLIVDPGLGLLFLVPGVSETLRVNGSGTRLLSGGEEWDRQIGSAVDRECFHAGILIRIAEVYYHCGRATKLADLWDERLIRRHRVEPPISRAPRPG